MLTYAVRMLSQNTGDYMAMLREGERGIDVRDRRYCIRQNMHAYVRIRQHT